jgi:hypothetical protein
MQMLFQASPMLMPEIALIREEADSKQAQDTTQACLKL